MTWANRRRPPVGAFASRPSTFRCLLSTRANRRRPRRKYPVNIPALISDGHQSLRVRLFVAFYVKRNLGCFFSTGIDVNEFLHLVSVVDESRERSLRCRDTLLQFPRENELIFDRVICISPLGNFWTRIRPPRLGHSGEIYGIPDRF